jgi:hypothetical protein
VSQPTDRSLGLRLAAAALFALSTAACTDYVERRETIAAHAGNAVAANRAIHTIDPWPPGSSRTEIEVSGRRVVDAIDRYEAPRPPGGGAAAPAIMAIPMTMPGASPAAN